MSAGFVSGGTIDNPTERDDEWLKAQQEIEAERRRKQEEGKQEGGRSLYDVLQQNKSEQHNCQGLKRPIRTTIANMLGILVLPSYQAGGF